MKIKIIKIISLALLPYWLQAQGLYNNNGIIQVNKDAHVTINGDFTTNSLGISNNQGTIQTTGNVSDASSSISNSTQGNWLLNGASFQSLGYSSPLTIKSITIQNPNGVELIGNFLSVDSIAQFNSGILYSSIPVIFNDNAIANNASDASHIAGSVVKFGIGNFVYPIGDSNYYQPIAADLSINDNGMQATYKTEDAGVAPFAGSTPLVAYNAAEHWDLTPFGNATGQVTVYWDAVRNTGINNTADLAVAHLHNNQWLNEGGTINSGSTTSSGSITSDPISTWSPFTLGSKSINSPLPLTIKMFEVIKNPLNNEILWEALNEENIASYTVEKSIDGVSFVSIGKTNAKQNSSGQISQYNMLDTNPTIGYNYYRLIQNTKNGLSSVTSDIKKVFREGEHLHTVVYPNPATDKVVLNIESSKTTPVYITILDATGKIVKQVVSPIEKGLNNVALNIQDIVNGTYQIQITDAARVQTKVVKLIKL
jgi:hypothetical protein